MDKYIDSLADKIAEEAKKKGQLKVYDLNEKLAYDKYVEVSKAAGQKPLSYEDLKKQRPPVKRMPFW